MLFKHMVFNILGESIENKLGYGVQSSLNQRVI